MVAWLALVGGGFFILLGLVLSISGRNDMEVPRPRGNPWEDVVNRLVFAPLARVVGWVVMFFGALIALIGLGVMASY